MRKMAAGVGKDLDPKDKEELSRSLDGGRESTLKRMGPGDTILGYKTEKYLLTGPLGQIEVHAAPSLEVPAAYFQANTGCSNSSTRSGKPSKATARNW